MEYVRLGKTGILVSELSLGTMTFGNEADEATSRRLMARALDVGINFFDTSTNYNKGATEEIIGRWIGPHRHEIILASKVFFPTGGGRNDEGLSRRNLLQTVENSLKRLQTDKLDLLYLHHWDENVAIEQTLAAVHTLVEQGKVIYCGVSNFAAWQTMKALAVAAAGRYPPVVATQPMYSLVKRQAEVEILPLAAYEGLAVVPYNAMAAGMLTGKYLRGASGRLTEVEMYRQRYGNPQYIEVTKRFIAHASEQGRSPAALAVAWVMSHPLVTSTIVGARSLDQFDETLQCLDMRLSPEERAAITALSPDPPSATDREPMDAMRRRGW
ncbi:MAG TPA: aldo/keto reductase [Candidatus Hydrogenedentes bacterium]|nr:aldo/keto reductase [Candidatus Hydrogenedentota bacterium]